MSDTIAAISTAVGEAGIGIVRISGSEAFNIGSKIFKGVKVKRIEDFTGVPVKFIGTGAGREDMIIR